MLGFEKKTLKKTTNLNGSTKHLKQNAQMQYPKNKMHKSSTPKT
jgi:hypothetical protein